MTDEAPRRYKEQDELDGDELLAQVQARHRGEDAPRFETPEYRQHRRDVLREGGLTDEADEDESRENSGKPLEEMSTAEHFDRLQRADPAGR
ncbi:MAG TPA: hypothetical protein VFK14_12460 [Solirubrobacterales bacterium]|nr:hypothetical protein [Solirubrobacterales bacterium]